VFYVKLYKCSCWLIFEITPSILESVRPMDPAFIDGRTQEYAAASGRNHCCSGTNRKGTCFGFYCDKGRDVGALLHAQEQTFVNALASPTVSETQKSENHVLCWEGYGNHLSGTLKVYCTCISSQSVAQ